MPRKRTTRRKTARKQQKTTFKRKVLRAVGSLTDRRYTYSTLGSTQISNSGAYVTGAQLCDTNLGDGTFGERQGDTITPTRIILRYTWAVSDAFNQCRLILFQWKPDSNSFPPTAVLNNVIDTSTLGGTNAPNSRYIFDQKNFHILYDSNIGLSKQGSNQIFHKTVNIYGKKLRPIRYTNGLTLGHNNIYMIAITDSALAAHPELYFTMEMHYKA